MNDSSQLITQKDPLSELLTDDVKAIDRQRLADLLKKYVILGSESGEMNFKETFEKLPNNSDKLEIVFLAEKARSLLFRMGADEGLRPEEIIKLEVMPPGSVKSTLKKFYDDKKVRKNPADKYYLPNYRLSELYKRFAVKED